VQLRSRRLYAAIVLAAVVSGVTLLALAMHQYPGGTELDRQSIGHSFWFNFLCDIASERALNGARNPGNAFGRAAMLVFAVGMGAFWMILPAEFPGHRALAVIVRVGGTISVLGFIASPIVSRAPWHALAVFAAAVPGVLAAVMGVAATVRYVSNKLLLSVAVGSIASATLASILYAQRVADGFRSCPPALPGAQRFTLLFVLAWATTVALRAFRPLTPRGIP
jgi:hypothetical protein